MISKYKRYSLFILTLLLCLIGNSLFSVANVQSISVDVTDIGKYSAPSNMLFDIMSGEVKLTVTGGDPFITITFSETIDTVNYKYMLLRCRKSKSDKLSGQIFYINKNVLTATEQTSYIFDYKEGENWQWIKLDVSSSVSIDKIRFDIFDMAPKDTYLELTDLIFFADEKDADRYIKNNSSPAKTGDESLSILFVLFVSIIVLSSRHRVYGV